MSPLFFKLIKKVVKSLDPKLEKYRPKKSTAAYTPKTKQELIDLLARAPKEVLSNDEREVIATAMSFSSKPVSSVMLPKSKMTFVHENDFLGPLTLSNLYKSGFEHFPVIGASGRITGLLHTKELNSLQVKETDRALKYLDENVYYVRNDHTLEMALAAFLRTNCHFFIVIDRSENPIGLITYKMVAEAMLGKKITDDFDDDLQLFAVARREP
jgi:CBS domain containing-hemolysin-like protein